MAKVTDLIASVGVGEDGVTLAYPDTFLADIGSAFDEDMGLADSRVSVLEADNAALVAENVALKAEMYSLIKQIPAAEGDPAVDDDTDSSDDGEPSADDITPDDLFGDDK